MNITTRFYIHIAALLAPLTASAATTVTFIHLNDLHAHLTPSLDLVATAKGTTQVEERGGLARTATLIQRIRTENPASVLMNIGDTYHGGVEALFTLGNAIVEPVNALGVDIGVPGNWDFAYGPAVFRRRYTDLPITQMMEKLPVRDVSRPNFPNLAANLSLESPGGMMPPRMRARMRERMGVEHAGLPATQIMEVGGVKVGFIGITSDIVAHMHKMLALGMNFTQGEDNYRTLIEGHARTLREQGARFIAVMSELGLQKDWRLANVIAPGSVDVFFSAHTHEAVFEPLVGKSGARVVEAGNHGWLGRMDVVFDEGNPHEFHWKLLPIGADLPEDPKLKALVEAARAPFLAPRLRMELPFPMGSHALTRPIDSVVGHADGPLDRRDVLESPFNNTFADLLRHTAGTDIALTPGFRFDAILAETANESKGALARPGAIRVEDLYRWFPVVYTLAEARIQGETLRNLIEKSVNSVLSPHAFEQGGGWVEGFSGLRILLDLQQPAGSRVIELRRADGRPINSDEWLSVAGCQRPFDSDETLCSHTGFNDARRLTDPATEKDWTPVDLLLDTLDRYHGKLAVSTRRDISTVAPFTAWPRAPYLQPLPPQ
jgi:2',3'-cyclic-nucleotide 2'-phosphodiesterase (5'-nucleotidase family)